MSGIQINRADWTAERIAAFKRFLGGDTSAQYRGRKKNGEPYKKALRVAKLVEYYKGYDFSFRNGKLFAAGHGYGPREVLTDDQVKSKAIGYYKHKETGLGKAPSIYQHMNRKYVNVSYKKVERAIQSLASYQKFQARHVKKPAARKVMITAKPGEAIDCDLMMFTTDYFAPSRNEGYGGLLVMVDRFSGFIAIDPFKHGKNGHTADIIAHKASLILQNGEFPTAKDGTIFHDKGSEFLGIFPERMRQLGYKDVIVSLAAGAPSPHAERAVGIIRKLINIKLTSDGRVPYRGKPARGRWWPLARTVVRGYNDTPMTDYRAPYSPNELKTFTGAKRKEIVKKMMESGMKRVNRMGMREDETGARVSKQLKILRVGDRVRYALENVRKTGAAKQLRDRPRQRWSDSVHTVARVVNRKLGFAVYVLDGLPRRRFEREDLQGPLVE